MKSVSIIKLVIPIIETYTPFQPKPTQAEDGYWFYGYGSACDPNGKSVTAKTYPISNTVAVELRDKHLHLLIEAIKKRLTHPVSTGMMAALVDYAYDVGMGRLLSNSILQAINLGAPDRARDILARDVYIRKNNRLMISKPREQRRKVNVSLWEKPDTI
jgi:GH24 family phage-related lysozyme (muramidase)